ncbi:MAG: glycosyltransferase [Clostridiales bacterium]|nr:glycosyltransferase [Clostridiales bacterium]
MDTHDLISIIIPIFNVEQYLDRCLRSLKAQTYTNIEFIMVDDGSTDNSASVCKKYAEEDNRFIYFYQENSGVSSARNKGLDLANGTFIGFCDADDWVSPNMYSKLKIAIDESGADLISCGFITETSNIYEKTECELEGRIEVVNAREAIADIIFDGTRIGGVELWSKLIKRQAIDSVRFVDDIKIGEDAVFILDVLLNCTKIAFIDMVLYHYLYRTNSACHNAFNNSMWTAQNGCRLILDKISQINKDLVPYAQKYLVSNNLYIAEKLACSQMLNKENYLRVKEEIKPYYKSAYPLLGKKLKIKIKFFMSNRLLFCSLYRIHGWIKRKA